MILILILVVICVQACCMPWEAMTVQVDTVCRVWSATTLTSTHGRQLPIWRVDAVVPVCNLCCFHRCWLVQRHIYCQCSVLVDWVLRTAVIWSVKALLRKSPRVSCKDVMETMANQGKSFSENFTNIRWFLTKLQTKISWLVFYSAQCICVHGCPAPNFWSGVQAELSEASAILHLPVPEENFWTLWCNGRLTDVDQYKLNMNNRFLKFSPSKHKEF